MNYAIPVLGLVRYPAHLLLGLCLLVKGQLPHRRVEGCLFTRESDA